MSEMYREDMNIGMGVMNFPNRKKTCLFVRQGNEYFKVASFNNDNAAELWWNTLMLLLYGKEKPNDQCGKTE